MKEVSRKLGFSEGGVTYVVKNKLKFTRKKRPKFTKNVMKRNVKNSKKK